MQKIIDFNNLLLHKLNDDLEINRSVIRKYI